MSIYTRGLVNIDGQHESHWLHVYISVYLTTLCELHDLDIFSIAWQDTRKECGGGEAIAVFIYHNGWRKTTEITTGIAICRERFEPGFFACEAELPLAMLGLSV